MLLNFPVEVLWKLNRGNDVVAIFRSMTRVFIKCGQSAKRVLDFCLNLIDFASFMLMFSELQISLSFLGCLCIGSEASPVDELFPFILDSEFGFCCRTVQVSAKRNEE